MEAMLFEIKNFWRQMPGKIKIILLYTGKTVVMKISLTLIIIFQLAVYHHLLYGYNEIECRDNMRKVLALLKNRQRESWLLAKPLLAMTLNSQFRFHERVYNQIASDFQILRERMPEEVESFFLVQPDFLRFVTKPYLLITKGGSFSIDTILVEKSDTLIFFTAPWCSSCSQYRKQLLDLTKIYPSFKIREIDLMHPGNPASKMFQKLHREALHNGIFTPAIFFYHNKRLFFSGSPEKFFDKLKQNQ